MSFIPEPESPKLVNHINGPIWVMPDGQRTAGPPLISVKFINLWGGPGEHFLFQLQNWDTTLDQAYLNIADDIRTGLYTLVSVTATQYEMVVVCHSKATNDDMVDALRKRSEKRNLAG